MARSSNSWYFQELLPIAVLVCIALVFLGNGCTPDTTGKTPNPTISDDGGLPLCPGGKVDDGTHCQRPESDGGLPVTDSSSPDPTDQGPQVSPDTDPAAADSGSKEECPPADIPDGTVCPAIGCTIYWDNSAGCSSDCSSAFGDPISPYWMRQACGFGTPS